ncbi:MAG: Hsp20/alpha crystallin family protein [Candidatus Omnitrophota bacterium]
MAKIVPWRRQESLADPFRSLEDMQREMNRVFNNFFLGEGDGSMRSVYAPAVDVSENENQIIVCADIPGMKKDAIDISVKNDVLTIRGQKEQQEEVREQDYIRSERYAGAFERSIVLSSMVDADNVQAIYKDGVLTVTLPKKEEDKFKQVKVKIE